MIKFIEMKTKDIKVLKEKMWIMNNKKCPVLDKEIPLEKMTLDHAHKNNNEEYAPNKGVIREVLDFRANLILGQVENAVKRTGLANDEDFDLPTFLRNAADYFEKGAFRDEDGNYYVHPSEVKKVPIVSKRNYKKLEKIYDKSAKFPEYPKSKKLTKKLNELFSEYNINPYN